MAVLGSGPGPFGGEGTHDIWTSTTMGCFAGPEGAWVLEIGAFHPAPAGFGENAPWRLVYLAPDAKRVTGSEARGENWQYVGEGYLTSGIVGVQDIDGDGVDEVMVRTSSYRVPDHAPTFSSQLFQVKDGAVARWVPVSGRQVVGSMDVDRDGRPNLLLEGIRPAARARARPRRRALLHGRRGDARVPPRRVPVVPSVVEADHRRVAAASGGRGMGCARHEGAERGGRAVRGGDCARRVRAITCVRTFAPEASTRWAMRDVRAARRHGVDSAPRACLAASAAC